MTWLDLYNYLHECAYNSKYIGKFPWQDSVKAFDFNSLSQYDVDLAKIITPQQSSRGQVTVAGQPVLSDAERGAVERSERWARHVGYDSDAATLRGLLDRHGVFPEREHERSIKVPNASGKNSNSTETVVLSINQI